jgi:hypothetical protein
MHLYDTLHVCLLALASRYPNNLIESNRVIVGDHAFCSGCRTAGEVVDWLQHTTPAMLEENAALLLNDQKCEIYLTDRDEQTPAYWIHCRGKMPAHTEDSQENEKGD